MTLITSIKQFILFLFKHKIKIAFYFLSVLIFIFLLFPMDDLSGFLSGKVSNLTAGQVFFQFDHLNFKLIPQAGVEIEGLYVEKQGLAPIKSDLIGFFPSILDFLAIKLGGTLRAQNLLNGDVEVSARGAHFSDFIPSKITVKTNTISITDMQKVIQLPVDLVGVLSLESEINIDSTFQKPPEGHLTANISKFELPPSSIDTPMGPLTLPSFSLSQLNLEGKLGEETLRIEKITLGDSNDEISGFITGSIGLTITKRNNTIATDFRGYELDFDLVLKDSIKKRAALFLTFIDQYQQPTSAGTRYAFRVAAPQFGVPPKISAIR